MEKSKTHCDLRHLPFRQYSIKFKNEKKNNNNTNKNLCEHRNEEEWVDNVEMNFLPVD